MSDTLRAKGQNGQVEFDGRNVTIRRGGVSGHVVCTPFGSVRCACSGSCWR